MFKLHLITKGGNNDYFKPGKINSNKTWTTNSAKAFKSTDDGCEFYGAVIGQILGGDNIIEKVSVGFAANADENMVVVDANSASHAKLVPIGGYVGVIENGGLIFKEMASECPWQKQHLSLYIVRWSAVCAPVSSSTSGKAERMKFQAAAIRSDRAVKPLLRQSYGSNKSSIKTSLSTMLWCIPFATPKVVTKVLTNDFRVFVFSLKIAIRRRKVCS